MNTLLRALLITSAYVTTCVGGPPPSILTVTSSEITFTIAPQDPKPPLTKQDLADLKNIIESRAAAAGAKLFTCTIADQSLTLHVTQNAAALSLRAAWLDAFHAAETDGLSTEDAWRITALCDYPNYDEQAPDRLSIERITINNPDHVAAILDLADAANRYNALRSLADDSEALAEALTRPGIVDLRFAVPLNEVREPERLKKCLGAGPECMPPDVQWTSNTAWSVNPNRLAPQSRAECERDPVAFHGTKRDIFAASHNQSIYLLVSNSPNSSIPGLNRVPHDLEVTQGIGLKGVPSLRLRSQSEAISKRISDVTSRNVNKVITIGIDAETSAAPFLMTSISRLFHVADDINPERIDLLNVVVNNPLPRRLKVTTKITMSSTPATPSEPNR